MHYPSQTATMTEEQRRTYLLTSERHRRHAEKRYMPTETRVFGQPEPAEAHHYTTSESHQAHTLGGGGPSSYEEDALGALVAKYRTARGW